MISQKQIAGPIVSWPTVAIAFILFSPLPVLSQEEESKPAVSASPSSDAAAKAPAEAVKAGEDPSKNPLTPVQGQPPNKSNMPPGKGGDPQAKPEGAEKPGGQPGKSGDAVKSEPPKPVLRSTKPSKPANADEFKVRPDADGKVKFNFQEQPWEPVLKWLAEISEMSLDWQKLPGDLLNLNTQRKYTVREARDLINQHLLARGYTILCNGEVLTVANIKELDPSLVPRVTPQELDKRDPHEFVKVSFTLDWMMAETLLEEVSPMKSPNGKMTALKATNRLEAIDAVINLREIWSLLKDEQSSDNEQRLVKEFVLKYARASDVYEQINTLLGGEAKGGAQGMGGPQPGMNPEQQQQAMMRMQQMQQQQQQQQQQQLQKQGGQPGLAKPPQPITLVVNQRRNSILATAPPDKMAIITQAVDAIDVPLDKAQSIMSNISRTQVYRLSGIDPEPIIKTLQDIGNLDPATRLQVDKKNKAIIVYAPLADHVTISAIVKKLSGSERQFEVKKLRRLSADYVAGSIMFMMGGEKKEKPKNRPYWMMDYGNQSTNELEKANEFRVEADVEHNRLLLWVNEVELAEVENLLIKLGEISPNGRENTVRVIEAEDGEEGQELIERIRRAWPTTSPNPLLMKPPETMGKPQLKPEEEKISQPVPASKSADLHSVDQELLKFVQFNRETTTTAEVSKTAPAQVSPPPVDVKIDADGRITVTSEDTEALDKFEELASQLAQPRKAYKVYKLKYASAYEVALNLKDFFKDDEKKESRSFFDMYYGSEQDDSKDQDSRLSKRRPVKFITDSESNTILVENADANQKKNIQELIDLYDQPPPSDSQSVRKTETIRLSFSKAKVVAETVKDVYRDLLSANDKALQGSKSNDRDTGRMFIFDSSGDDGKKEQKMPKFKGQLSIGIDELSNSLVVSAPAYIFDQVHKMIVELDEAAAPTSTVQVIKLGPGVSSQQTQEALSEILGDGSSKKKSQDQNKPQPQSRNRQQQGNNRNRSNDRQNSR